MPHDRILKKILSDPWAIEESWLEKIAAIAEREVDIVALEAKRGEPLDYTRTVTVRGNVALIPLDGPIFPKANIMTAMSGATSLEVLAQDFQAAQENEAVDTIVFKINSPGGQITGIDEMYSLLKTSEKKVIAHVSGSVASAAYWIAVGADEIILTPTSQAGSIGIVQVWNLDAADDTNRLEFVNSASPRKRLDPKSDEGKMAILKEIDSIAEVFISNVADGRSVSPEDVKQKFGKGGMLIGQEAVDVGMADCIMTFEELMADLSGQNYSSYGEISMNVKELKAKHPEVYEEILAEGKAAAEGETSGKVDDLKQANEALAAENTKLKADLDNQAAENKDAVDRLKVLERKDAIRDAQAAEAKAASIMTAALADSVIPKNLHGKVAASVKHTVFMADDGPLDVEAYTMAVTAEIKDWAASFDAATPPLAGGAGDSGDEGHADNNETVDTAVDSLFAHIN